jgi:hypothetical protein
VPKLQNAKVKGIKQKSPQATTQSGSNVLLLRRFSLEEIDGLTVGGGRFLCRRQVWRPPNLTIMVAPQLVVFTLSCVWHSLEVLNVSSNQPMPLRIDVLVEFFSRYIST